MSQHNRRAFFVLDWSHGGDFIQKEHSFAVIESELVLVVHQHPVEEDHPAAFHLVASQGPFRLSHNPATHSVGERGKPEREGDGASGWERDGVHRN